MSCYVIKSRLNDLVLDVRGAETKPGAHVITYSQHGGDNQLWYDDPVTGTIRSKQTRFCLSLDDDTLVVRPYEKEDLSQQWERVGAFIQSRNNCQKVLDIYGAKKSRGAKVGPYEYHGRENQQWAFETTDIPAPVESDPTDQSAASSLYPHSELQQAAKDSRREFWIVNEETGRVLDIQARSTSPNAKVILWEKHPSPEKNQLWYFDSDGFIRSTLNDFVFKNDGSGKRLKTSPADGHPRGQWSVDDKKIVNRLGECLDYVGRKDENGAELISKQYKGSPSQHWMLQYF